MERRVQGPGELGEVLPADDPLLLEAEPWCDQATMRYYPDIYPMKGWETQIPNLMFQLTFARSWVARGMAASDPSKAMEDFRRAIRLGRLLRQEDVTVIADLVGLACIRVGAQGIYDLAVKQGNAQLALVASIVLGEVAPQRLCRRPAAHGDRPGAVRAEERRGRCESGTFREEVGRTSWRSRRPAPIAASGRRRSWSWTWCVISDRLRSARKRSRF